MRKLLLLLCVMLGVNLSATVVNLGYSNDWDIYVRTGIQFAADGDVDAAIRIPVNMLADYSGSKIIGIRLALGDDAKNLKTKAFMRIGSLTAADAATGEESYTFDGKWQQILFNQEWTIPEGLEQDIYVGYSCSVPKSKFVVYTSMNKCAADPEQCYLRHSKLCPEWIDLTSDPSAKPNSNLTINALLQRPDGTYETVALLKDVIVNNVTYADEDNGALYVIHNDGGKDITKLTLKYTLGEETFTKTVTLNSPLPSGQTANRGIYLPFHSFGTGTHTVEITKVNGKDNGASQGNRARTVDVVSVPADVAEGYTRRPLYEYYCSEDDYNSGVVQDELVLPGLKQFKGRYTYLAQHSGFDKFAQNPKDVNAYVNGEPAVFTLSDADRLLIRTQGDINKLYVPMASIDRAVILQNVMWLGRGNGVFGHTLYPEAFIPVMEEALTIPTFAKIELTPTYDPASRMVTVKVTGDIASGVLPEHEVPYITLFLTEEGVKSDSQEFPQNAEIPNLYPDGIFTHHSVVRQTITPFDGIETPVGTIDQTIQFEIENPRWDVNRMKIVGIIQRPATNDRWHTDVINSTEAPLTADYEDYTEASISNVSANSDAPASFYDLSGRRLTTGRPAAGFYIISNGTTTKKVIVK